MTDKIELKPCPFCGGKAFLDSEFSGVYCYCGAELTFLESDKEAAEKWNSRPIEDELQKDLRRFKKYSAALEKEVKTLREALTFYAKGEHLGLGLEDWQMEQVLKDDEVFAESYCETGKVAREALKGGAE